MNLPSKELQRAYYTALNGNITYNGSVVPVYDLVPTGADYPFIHLGDQIVRENGTKDSFISDVIMQVDIVTGFEAGFGGKAQMYDIADLVSRAIVERVPSVLSLSGFNLFKSQLDVSSFLEDQTDTHILYINRIRFRHLIQQV